MNEKIRQHFERLNASNEPNKLDSLSKETQELYRQFLIEKFEAQKERIYKSQEEEQKRMMDKY